MSGRDDGGPAFPHTTSEEGVIGVWGISGEKVYGAVHRQNGGMSMREFFAAKASAGICASRDEAGVLIQHGYDWVAREAYRIADAMLKERAK